MRYFSLFEVVRNKSCLPLQVYLCSLPTPSFKPRKLTCWDFQTATQLLFLGGAMRDEGGWHQTYTLGSFSFFVSGLGTSHPQRMPIYFFTFVFCPHL